MKTFTTKTTIDAPVEHIWALLIDAAGYPSWNTTVDRVEGRIAPGEKVKVFAKLSPGRAFAVKVTELVDMQRMVWSGGMPLGLFKGERTFTLSPSGRGVEFAMQEVLSGLLSPLIERSLPDGMQASFEEFAADLKKRAEQAR